MILGEIAGKNRDRERLLVRLLALGCLILAFIASFLSVGCAFKITNSLSPRGDGELRLHFLDVGQGDCTWIELPDGKQMLIDGGTASAEGDILAFAEGIGAEKIDYLAITTTDEDHCGGFGGVLSAFEIGKAYLPYQVLNASEAFTSASETVKEKALSVQDACAYATIEGEGYFIAFLSPHSKESVEGLSLDKNELSSVIWLDYGGVSAIFCSDISASVEERLLTEWQLGGIAFPETVSKNLHLDSTEIVKAANHGGSASTAEFISTLGAKTAVISCGKNNAYRYPSSEVLTNFANVVGVNGIYRTDECGRITITVTAQGEYAVSTQQ